MSCVNSYLRDFYCFCSSSSVNYFILLYITRHLKGLSFRRKRENPRINLDRKRYAVNNSTFQFLEQAKQYWNCLFKGGSLTPSFVRQWGALTSTTAMAAKTEHRKWVRAGSSFELFAPISSCSICEMLANFSGVEFKGLFLSSGKEKLFFSCVHVAHILNLKLGGFTPYLCNNGREM